MFRAIYCYCCPKRLRVHLTWECPLLKTKGQAECVKNLYCFVLQSFEKCENYDTRLQLLATVLCEVHLMSWELEV